MCRDLEAAGNLEDVLAATKPGEPAMSMAGARYRGRVAPDRLAGHALNIQF